MRPTQTSTSPPQPLLGLHVRVAATPAGLCPWVWIERASSVDGFRQRVPMVSGLRRHPAHVRAAERPAWIPDDWRAVQAQLELQALGLGHPVPLPGLATHWKTAGVRLQGRTTSEQPFLVDGFFPPASAWLRTLPALVHGFRDRFGASRVAPPALALAGLLDGLRQRWERGPLLPVLAPLDPRTLADAPHWSGSSLGWVPPTAMVDVMAWDRALHSIPGLFATLAAPAQDRVRRSSHPYPTDTAWFVLRAFSHARMDPSHPAYPDADARAAMVAGLQARKGPLRELHALHGNVLTPWDTVFDPPAGTRATLEADLRAADDGGRSGGTLTLGLTGETSFVPLADLLPAQRIRDTVVDTPEGRIHRPAVVAAQSLHAIAQSVPWLGRHPALFTGAPVPLGPEARDALVRLGSIVESRNESAARMGLSVGGRGGKHDDLIVRFVPHDPDPPRLRVRWTPSGPLPGSDPGAVAAARTLFTAGVTVVFGGREWALDEAESLVRATGSEVVTLPGSTSLVRKAAVVEALERARARAKVLARLTEGRPVPLGRVLEIEDDWVHDAEARALESVFDTRWTEFLASLREARGTRVLTAPPAPFRGTLRPYQLRGVQWLDALARHGFGAVLADEMGLGKTVQVLGALAVHVEARRAGTEVPPDLVLAPTSVVGNWAREAARFVPDARVQVFHGSERARTGEALAAMVSSVDLVVTSYGIARRDAERLSGLAWNVLVMDEAHHLKNPQTQQARAVRQLEARHRIALTGTPIENRVWDLWSIFHQVEPGILGGPARFARGFGTAVQRGDTPAEQRLRARIAPFLLRRRKSDPGVAEDLPERVEVDVECGLTSEQSALYETVVEAMARGLKDRTGMERRASVFTALTHLKQICNHPEQFHVDRPEQLEGRSGKLDRVLELIGELIEADQPALLFTQYVEAGVIVQRAVAARFGVEVPFFHGGLDPSARDEMVAAFQSPDGPPLLLLSLRAGGTGLNLTRARAVIHFDRWWNPAVEDQATDRAHRIGQTRAVEVFRLITRGTLEERIAEMLEDKRALAGRLVGGAQDAWVTEMTDDALRAFVALDEDRARAPRELDR